jgi:SAPK-interacting protein 1 (Sin1), middle CRIM domain
LADFIFYCLSDSGWRAEAESDNATGLPDERNLMLPRNALHLLSVDQPADPDKTPISNRHFFTSITEPDDPYFNSPLQPLERNGNDSGESPAPRHAALQPFHDSLQSDKTPSATPSPQIPLREIMDEGSERLGDRESSELGSPVSLADDGILSDSIEPQLLEASIESDGHISPLRERMETEEVRQARRAFGLVSSPSTERTINRLSRTEDQSRRASTVVGFKGEGERGDADYDMERRLSQEPVDNDWFSSLKVDSKEIAQRRARSKPISALSAKLKKQESAPENPFSAFYTGVAARSSGAPSISVDLYFPFAVSVPQGKPSSSSVESVDAKTKCMKVKVRKDATMEELIGFGLYCYIEEGWSPRFWENVPESEQDTKLTTIGWVLRIVEDGEVDEDYPAIDRTLTVGGFGNDEFAIVEASKTQVAQNKATYQNIKRRVSRTVATNKLAMSNLEPAAASKARKQALAGSVITTDGTPIFAASALGRSLNTPLSTSIFLRVLVTPNPEVRYKTTLQVPSEMYLADVLEMICRKRRLASPGAHRPRQGHRRASRSHCGELTRHARSSARPPRDAWREGWTRSADCSKHESERVDLHETFLRTCSTKVQHLPRLPIGVQVLDRQSQDADVCQQERAAQLHHRR